MKTENKMNNEKKVYNTPELVEHGSLVEMTRENSSGPQDFEQGSQSNIIMP